MNWYLEVLKKYAVFSGRARRKEYWFFVLFNMIIAILITIVDIIVGTYDPVRNVGILNSLYNLGVLLPSVAVTVRRLHDTDRSERWLAFPVGTTIVGGILIWLMMGSVADLDNISPAIGLAIFLIAVLILVSYVTLFVFMVLNSTPGANRFGPNPINMPEPGYMAQQKGYQNEQPKIQVNPNQYNHPQTQSTTLRGMTPLVSPIILYADMEVVVGRSSRANVVVSNSYVSGQHLSLKAVGNEVVIKDLGSTNGTYIDGQKLQPYVPMTLHPGQKLIIGSEDIVYTI